MEPTCSKGNHFCLRRSFGLLCNAQDATSSKKPTKEIAVIQAVRVFENPDPIIQTLSRVVEPGDGLLNDTLFEDILLNSVYCIEEKNEMSRKKKKKDDQTSTSAFIHSSVSAVRIQIDRWYIHQRLVQAFHYINSDADANRKQTAVFNIFSLQRYTSGWSDEFPPSFLGLAYRSVLQIEEILSSNFNGEILENRVLLNSFKNLLLLPQLECIRKLWDELVKPFRYSRRPCAVSDMNQANCSKPRLVCNGKNSNFEIENGDAKRCEKIKNLEKIIRKLLSLNGKNCIKWNRSECDNLQNEYTSKVPYLNDRNHFGASTSTKFLEQTTKGVNCDYHEENLRNCTDESFDFHEMPQNTLTRTNTMVINTNVCVYALKKLQQKAASCKSYPVEFQLQQGLLHCLGQFRSYSAKQLWPEPILKANCNVLRYLNYHNKPIKKSFSIRSILDLHDETSSNTQSNEYSRYQMALSSSKTDNSLLPIHENIQIEKTKGLVKQPDDSKQNFPSNHPSNILQQKGNNLDGNTSVGRRRKKLLTRTPERVSPSEKRGCLFPEQCASNMDNSVSFSNFQGSKTIQYLPGYINNDQTVKSYTTKQAMKDGKRSCKGCTKLTKKGKSSFGKKVQSAINSTLTTTCSKPPNSMSRIINRLDRCKVNGDANVNNHSFANGNPYCLRPKSINNIPEILLDQRKLDNIVGKQNDNRKSKAKKKGQSSMWTRKERKKFQAKTEEKAKGLPLHSLETQQPYCQLLPSQQALYNPLPATPTPVLNHKNKHPSGIELLASLTESNNITVTAYKSFKDTLSTFQSVDRNSSQRKPEHSPYPCVASLNHQSENKLLVLPSNSNLYAAAFNSCNTASCWLNNERNPSHFALKPLSNLPVQPILDKCPHRHFIQGDKLKSKRGVNEKRKTPVIRANVINKDSQKSKNNISSCGPAKDVNINEQQTVIKSFTSEPVNGTSCNPRKTIEVPSNKIKNFGYNSGNKHQIAANNHTIDKSTDDVPSLTTFSTKQQIYIQPKPNFNIKANGRFVNVSRKQIETIIEQALDLTINKKINKLSTPHNYSNHDTNQFTNGIREKENLAEAEPQETTLLLSPTQTSTAFNKFNITNCNSEEILQNNENINNLSDSSPSVEVVALFSKKPHQITSQQITPSPITPKDVTPITNCVVNDSKNTWSTAQTNLESVTLSEGPEMAEPNEQFANDQLTKNFIEKENSKDQSQETTLRNPTKIISNANELSSSSEVLKNNIDMNNLSDSSSNVEGTLISEEPTSSDMEEEDINEAQPQETVLLTPEPNEQFENEQCQNSFTEEENLKEAKPQETALRNPAEIITNVNELSSTNCSSSEEILENNININNLSDCSSNAEVTLISEEPTSSTSPSSDWQQTNTVPKLLEQLHSQPFTERPAEDLNGQQLNTGLPPLLITEKDRTPITNCDRNTSQTNLESVSEGLEMARFQTYPNEKFGTEHFTNCLLEEENSKDVPPPETILVTPTNIITTFNEPFQAEQFADEQFTNNITEVENLKEKKKLNRRPKIEQFVKGSLEVGNSKEAQPLKTTLPTPIETNITFEELSLTNCNSEAIMQYKEPQNSSLGLLSCVKCSPLISEETFQQANSQPKLLQQSQYDPLRNEPTVNVNLDELRKRISSKKPRSVSHKVNTHSLAINDNTICNSEQNSRIIRSTSITEHSHLNGLIISFDVHRETLTIKNNLLHVPLIERYKHMKYLHDNYFQGNVDNRIPGPYENLHQSISAPQLNKTLSASNDKDKHPSDGSCYFHNNQKNINFIQDLVKYSCFGCRGLLKANEQLYLILKKSNPRQYKNAFNQSTSQRRNTQPPKFKLNSIPNLTPVCLVKRLPASALNNSFRNQSLKRKTMLSKDDKLFNLQPVVKLQKLSTREIQSVNISEFDRSTILLETAVEKTEQLCKKFLSEKPSCSYSSIAPNLESLSTQQLLDALQNSRNIAKSLAHSGSITKIDFNHDCAGMNIDYSNLNIHTKLSYPVKYKTDLFQSISNYQFGSPKEAKSQTCIFPPLQSITPLGPPSSDSDFSKLLNIRSNIVPHKTRYNFELDQETGFKGFDIGKHSGRCTNKLLFSNISRCAQCSLEIATFKKDMLNSIIARNSACGPSATKSNTILKEKLPVEKKPATQFHIPGSSDAQENVAIDKITLMVPGPTIVIDTTEPTQCSISALGFNNKFPNRKFVIHNVDNPNNFVTLDLRQLLTNSECGLGIKIPSSTWRKHSRKKLLSCHMLDMDGEILSSTSAECSYPSSNRKVFHENRNIQSCKVTNFNEQNVRQRNCDKRNLPRKRRRRDQGPSESSSSYLHKRKKL